MYLCNYFFYSLLFKSNFTIVVPFIYTFRNAGA